jgi:outer membrane biosynthesis protein TonB
MKTIIQLPLVVGLGLSFSVASRAQDAATRPLQEQAVIQTEETPSPTPAATPALKAPEETTTEPEVMPTPIPQTPPEKAKQAPAPKPEKKSAAKPEPSPPTTPERHAIKPAEAPVAKAEPTAVETKETRATRKADAATLKELEKEWEASFNDPAVIEKVVADDFVGTSRDGKVISKRSLVREARRNTGPAPETVAHDLDVHFYGPNIAVVLGGAKQTNKSSAGQKLVHNFRFTDTWVKRDGQWQCVASQSILLPKR